MDNVSIQHNAAPSEEAKENELSFEARTCPFCNMKTIKGMRGSPDSICKNCGYKDPCCYD